MESILTDRLATLSHPQRLAIFRLLIRRYPNELPAGEIAQSLGLKASTASVYLSALTQSGMITQRRDGTRLLYAANLAAAQDLFSGLFSDCCGGRADICPPALSGVLQNLAPQPGQRFNVLFVCTGNSARSIFAETILRDMAGDRFRAYSAGTAHQSTLNPFAVAQLKERAHDVSHLRAKAITEFQGVDAPRMDFIFTVCDRAANEDCPAWPGQPVSGHWGVPDPANVSGDNAIKQLAFSEAYSALHRRIRAFTALPFDQMDRVTLQRNIDNIGNQDFQT